MSKRKTIADKGLSNQKSLFDNGPDEGELDIVLGLKQCLSRLLKGHDRYMVAAQISRATLKDLSKDMLDKLLSSDPAYQPSAVHVTAICRIAGEFEPFRYLLEPLDADVLLPEDKDLVEMARLEEEQRRIEGRLLEIRRRRGFK